MEFTEVYVDEDYWEAEQGDTFQIYKCSKCGCNNSISWSVTHNFNSYTSDEEDNNKFKHCLEK